MEWDGISMNADISLPPKHLRMLLSQVPQQTYFWKFQVRPCLRMLNQGRPGQS